MYFIATRRFLQNLCNSLCKRILWSAVLCAGGGAFPMEWNGMEWYGMEWNGMEWNGTSIPAEPGCAIGVRGKQQDLNHC